MRIALIDGSPKAHNSTSGSLLRDLKERIGDRAGIAEMALHGDSVSEKGWRELKEAQVWVFAFPLYIDGIPAHLLSCLEQLERNCGGDSETSGEKKDVRTMVYAMVNCGFYEGSQTKHGLRLMENWCAKSGLVWGGGIGVGGGGTLAMMPDTPPGRGPKAPVDMAVGQLAERILRKESGENSYVSVAFPRVLYQLCGQLGWRRMIKANGGSRRDLGKRPK